MIILCYLIRRHYDKATNDIKKLEDDLPEIVPFKEPNPGIINKTDMTAIQLVSGYNGFGIHTFFSIIKSFPNQYKNFIFVSVAVIDQGLFKGDESLQDLKESVKFALEKYVELARSYGFNAEYRMDTGTEVVETATDLIAEITKEYYHSIVFSGRLAFRVENFYHRILHNETSYTIQRRLQWKGITNVILPIRMGL